MFFFETAAMKSKQEATESTLVSQAFSNNSTIYHYSMFSKDEDPLALRFLQKFCISEIQVQFFTKLVLSADLSAVKRF